MSNGNAENVSPNPLSDVMQYVYAKAAQVNAMNDGAGYGANANNCDACIRQRRAYQRECVWTANVDGGDGQDTLNMTGATGEYTLNMSNVQTLGLTGNSNNETIQGNNVDGMENLQLANTDDATINTERMAAGASAKLHEGNIGDLQWVASDTTAVNDGIGSSGHNVAVGDV